MLKKLNYLGYYYFAQYLGALIRPSTKSFYYDRFVS